MENCKNWRLVMAVASTYI